MKLTFPKTVLFYNNKDFRTIVIRVFFFFDSILTGILSEMTEDYPSEEKLKIAKLENYILNCGCRNAIYGSKSAIYFDLIIPDSYTLEEDYIERQIKLFEGLIYRPMVKDNKFLDFEVERFKKMMETYINNSYKDLRAYQDIKLRNLVDDTDNGYLTMDITDHPEIIKVINSDKLYHFYLDKVFNNNCFVMAMGNIEEDKICSLINKYIVHKPLKELEVNYYSYLKINKEINEVNEKGLFKDSSLSYIYKIKDCSKDDDLMLEVINGLLSSQSSRLLGKKLRDEEELVYSTKVIPYTHFGMFEITAFINKDNKKIVGDKILEVIEDLKNKELIKPLLENLKERRRINLLRSLDSIYSISLDHFNEVFKLDDTQEEKYKKMLNISEDDIANFMERFVLDSILFIEEEDE